MKLFLASAALFGMLMSCNNNAGKAKETTAPAGETKVGPAVNTLSDEEKSSGWQLLFDGQSSKGWHKYGGDPVGTAWKIADGAIFLDTTGRSGWKVSAGGDIVTDGEYDNFDLKLQWKISPGGNSGVMFFVHEDTTRFKDTYESGPEMQILDNDGHPDGKITKHRAGDLYDMISCSKETVKPVGEWNDVEIKALNGKLELYLNGVNVVSTSMWDDNWNTLIAGSKFKSWPGFGSYKKGHIAIQDHGFMVWYRDIKIRKL